MSRLLLVPILAAFAFALPIAFPVVSDSDAAAARKPRGKGNSEVGGEIYQGVEITCPLPDDLHIKNIGSKRDGAGMCVMSSIEMAARWQGLEQLRGLRDWAAQFSGGAYPSKVDQQLKKYFAEKGIAPIPYLQYEGKSPEEILDLIDRTGRMACITYNYGPRYGGRISHMTCCPHYRGQYGVCLDNNFPRSYEWMPKAELIARMKGGGGAWVFVWLPPGPPPPPKLPQGG